MTNPEPGGAAAKGEQTQRVLVEMRVQRTRSGEIRLGSPTPMADTGFEIDPDYDPVPVGGAALGTREAADEDVVVVRGAIAQSRIAELEARPDVLRVWRDTPIAPFAVQANGGRSMPLAAAGPCPTDTCDCEPETAGGDIAAVAHFLGVERLWAEDIRGNGIIIGVVDGGITAQGRPVRAGETADVPRVIGGWPSVSWGTTAAAWGRHGNMTATDALGMAPAAQLYDIRISDGDAISTALAGFQWAIDQHRRDGTPHVLTNSWGIYQESWDPEYARNAEHPFTRKAVEAINEGILVLFAAGNCGAACPSDRCGADNGPGRSIWGANGHPEVITVGAANLQGVLAGYSSQGPAALDERKPDFCSITHFEGYFASDNGTSAACPIAAGVTALLKQAAPALTQRAAKQALIDTARDLGPAGWDPHTGAGIIQAAAAWERVRTAEPRAPEPANTTQRVADAGVLAPAAAVLAGGTIALLITGPDHALYRSTRSGVAWSAAERIGGTAAYPPAVLQGDSTELFTIGPSGELYRRSGDAAWRALGGSCTRGLAAVAPAAGRIEIFSTGANGTLYHKSINGSRTARWRNLGGELVSAPAAVARADERTDVFYLGVDSAVWQRHWDGRRWSEAQSLGGSCLWGVAAAAIGEHMDVFAVFTDHALYRKHWDGTVWSEWRSLGGSWASAPAAVAADGAVYVFVAAPDGGMYQLTFDTAPGGT